jgi:hypothetical protein
LEGGREGGKGEGVRRRNGEGSNNEARGLKKKGRSEGTCDMAKGKKEEK